MRGLRFFLIGFLASLPFWLGVNLGFSWLEKFFYQQVFYPPEEVLLAQVPRTRFFQTSDFEIKAKSGLVLKLAKDGNQWVVFKKNPKTKLPIASLTKLMTSLVALDFLPLSRKIEITRPMLSPEGDTGNLRVGEKIAVGQLLKMMLVESSNDAAQALALAVGQEKFVNLMNLKAKELGLHSTSFSSPTGLEADGNFSTSEDLANLLVFLLKTRPLLAERDILEISRQPVVEIFAGDGKLHHRAINTNELLDDFGQLGLEVVGGKTGFTQEAGGCVLLVVRDRQGNYFINVLLGADSPESRFVEMRKLVEKFN